MIFNSHFYAKRTMMWFVTYVMIFLTVLLTSCSKDDDADQPMPDVIAFSVIHASPDAGDVDFFFDNMQVNSNGYGFLKRLGYFGSYAGYKKLEVKAPGIGRLLLGENVAMKGNTTYSIYIAGKKEKLEYVITEDDLTLPAAGKAKIRFVNLSPDADAIDLGTPGNPPLFSGNNYKASTIFQEISAGTVNLELRNATGFVTATSTGVKLESGKIYTIYAKGLVSVLTGDQKFGIEVVNNL
jgi:hypothetical protein